MKGLLQGLIIFVPVYLVYQTGNAHWFWLWLWILVTV